MNQELTSFSEKLEMNSLDWSNSKTSSYFLLVLTSFFGAFALGFLKFFALGYLTNEVYKPEDKVWIIQIVGALITLGPALIYLFSGPLAASFKKRFVMAGACTGVVFFLGIGTIFSWPGTPWLYLFIAGLLMGIFSAAKMALVPIESNHSGRTTYQVNGIMSIAFIVGTILGLTSGTWCYDNIPQYSGWLSAGFFVVSACVAYPVFYPNEKSAPFARSQSKLLRESIQVFGRFPIYLISSGLIWGCAGALSLAVTAYAELLKLGTATECSLMLLYATLGIMAGTWVSVKLIKWRFVVVALSCLILTAMVAVVPLLPAFGESFSLETSGLYNVLAFWTLIIGTLLGIAINLIDSALLAEADEAGFGVTGAAIQSAFLSLFSFVIGGGIGLIIYLEMLSAETQFVVLSGLLLLTAILTVVNAFKHGYGVAFFLDIATKIFYFILHIRYRVEVMGLKELSGGKEKILFLPNHPAEIDPVILGCVLRDKYRPRPVVIEDFYEMPAVNQVMRMMKAICMPNIELGGGYAKRRKIEIALDDTVQALNDGDNVLIYPAGKLKRDGLEELGAASGVYQTVKQVENVRLVLVRTKGLWGSIFSTAVHAGATPDFLKSLIFAFKSCLASLLFFMPKRRIEIEFKEIQFNESDYPDAVSFNRSLENFYNQNGEEELKLFPYTPWSKDVSFTLEKGEEKQWDAEKFDSAKVEEFLNQFSRRFEVPPHHTLSLNTRLAEDLGMDSLIKAEVGLWLEEIYDANDIEPHEVQTLGCMLEHMSKQSQTQKTGEGELTPQTWKDVRRSAVIAPQAKTIQENFLRTCDRMAKQVAMSDEMNGVLTYDRLKLAVMLFARVFKDLPGDKVGIMLPASVAANISVLACMIAKKTPVMLNWTVGRRPLEQCVEASGVEAIVTSARFMDKLSATDFGAVAEKLLFIEDLKKDKIKWPDMACAFLESRMPTDKLMDQYDLNDVDEDSPAVILFTSGSESAPKGVPLTHSNIINNIRGSMQAMDFRSDDVIYGFLPPFHSFGLTVTTLMPLMSGLKATYHPNPTQASVLAKGIHKWGVSLMCATPTFSRSILRSAKPEQLQSLRVIVSGAEKLSEDVVELAKSKNDKILFLEGYGITECAPVVCLQRQGIPRTGVGQPLEGIDLLIVDPDTHEAKAQGERGLILVAGKNVFGGYLQDIPSPFVQKDNRNWYSTGDLGYLTEDGQLVLAGRMKRFVKVAGEMISLPAMEDALKEACQSDEEGPQLAVHAQEREGERPVFHLLTTFDISVEDANDMLRKAGIARVAKIGKVKKLDELPLLGTGKIDYRSLGKLATAE